jgi:acyl-CoA oxidase
VAAVETTANYDPVSGGFVLNSPTPTSAKWWIGAAANTANVSVIFAQLIVEGVQKGVHAFAVPIRNYETHELFPGVFIGDCGKKIALDGIDNGFILFHNYSIPYDCLLDKFSQIREGKFKSLIKNKDKRLGVMMAGLIRGRFAVISGSEINARICLTIALRYSATRKQFGPSNELPIINYQLQKHRLIPALAKTIAIRCGIKGFLSMYINSKSKIDADPECDELNEIHSLLSSIKAVSSWMAIGIVQDCREACGGLGFSAYSSLGRYKSYQDIHTTWEGDNSVLIQQTGKYILKIVQKSFKGQKINPSTLSFLKFDLEEIKNFKAMFTRREDLENEKCLIELLEYRVNYLMHTSLLRLQENSVAALDITEAWNNSQIYHIQDLSKAYGELMMAKEFIKFYTVLSSECKETGDIMQKFFFLYCVDRIVNNISCYFDGAVTSSQERIAKDSILKLSSELAEVSVKIVDALSAPDSLIDSAIGSTDGQAYFNMIKSVQSKPIVYSKPKLLDLIRKVRVSTD